MSRYYEEISKKDFQNLIFESNTDENYLIYKTKEDDYFIFDFHKKVKKDLSKVIFDFENVYNVDLDDKETNVFLGIQRIKDFTFFGCWAGGDWEFPVYFILYWDGKDVRGYIPEEGNTFDKKWKTAFGSQTEREDCDLDEEELHPENEPIPDYDLMIKDILNRIKRKII